jgi:hypothetical protein
MNIGDGHAAPKSDVGDVSRAYYKLKEALENDQSPLPTTAKLYYY